MLKRNLRTLILCCSLAVAGQSFAADNFLPTVILRDYENGDDAKYELTYDNNGRITTAKEYRKQENSDYQLANTRTFEYHRLPNGEYVKTKDEIVFAGYMGMTGGNRTVASYDANGMQLFKRRESKNSSGDWEITGGTRAVLNQGIRTGIEKYEDNSWVLDTDYTFDSKGRLIRNGDNEDYVTYTWGEGLNELTGATMFGDGKEMIFSNFTLLKNMEYFNAYDLALIFGDSEDSEPGYHNVGELVPYAWDDYTSHQMVANMTVNALGQTGTYNWTIDDNAGVWTQILTLGSEEVERTVIELLANGGWKKTYTGNNRTSEYSMEYDEYGAFIREFYEEIYNGSPSGQETNYSREYDAQDHPTKTTKTNNSSVEYVETYTAWANINSGINTHVPDVVSLSAYPTVTSGIVYIDNSADETISAYNIYGTKLLETSAQSVDLSAYPNGLYIIKAGNRTVKVIKN